MQDKEDLKFVLAFDVLDKDGKSVLKHHSANGVVVNFEGELTENESVWSIPLLLGMYAKHIASMPEFKKHFPWYEPTSKVSAEIKSNTDHKDPHTPFVFLLENIRFERLNKRTRFCVEDSIPTGFPL